MAVDAFSLLTLFSITIVLGYVGSLIFERTRIPDILWLLIFGIIIGPVLKLVDVGIFIAISPFLAALALMLILFDAGLNMDLYQMIRGFSRGMLLAIVGFTLSIITVAIISIYLLKFDLLTGILLGSIIGGTSSPIVISIVSKMKMSQRAKTVTSLDTIFSDPLVIVVAIAILNIITSTVHVVPTDGVSSIFGAFSIGAVVGFISGVVWLFALEKLKGKQFDYMLTLAVLFILYVLVESTNGSGAIASLAFGLVLGNGQNIAFMLRTERKLSVNHLLMSFQSEVSFFIRSFFFVYIGIIAVLNQQYALYGVIISAALIFVRYIAVRISTVRSDITKAEKNIMAVLVPRGLAAAVLAQLPLSYGIKYADVIFNIVFVVILVTVLYTTFTVRFASREHINISEGTIQQAKEEENIKEIDKSPKKKTSKKKHR